MKHLKFWGIAMLVSVAALFQSCDDNDGYSLGDIAVDMVTVHKYGETGCTFTGDTWGTIWPAAPVFTGYRPEEGQRAMLYFNPLYDDFEGYDVAVKVEGIKPILTKRVEEMNAANEAEYGDDPVRVTDAWIAGGYMNIIFDQFVPRQQPHRVSLVKNMDKVQEDDGYVHLEYRYNTYGDVTSNVLIRSIVCYNLSTLDMRGKKGIKMRINSAVNGERELVFDSLAQPLPENADKDVVVSEEYNK